MSNICFPPFLKPGDGIAIISSARKIAAEIIEEAKSLIEQRGFRVFLGENLLKSEHQFAGTDEERASDFNEAIKNPNIKAIFFARGGYGSIRLVDKIDWNYFKKNPKWLVGYSDITVFHSVCHSLGIASIHSTMPVNYKKNSKEAIDELFSILAGKGNKVPVNYQGDAKSGQLIGGNLSIIYSLSGTPYQLNSSGKLLFVEDLDEYLYHVDRMFQNLKYSKQLNSDTQALILGGLTDMNDNAIPFGLDANESANKMAEELDISFAHDLLSGHQNDNRPLCLGATYTLSDNFLKLSDPTFPK